MLALPGNLAADPRQGEFAVHDLSLWIADSAGTLANARADFSSSFPATVNSTRAARTSLSEKRVGPLGLLTFHGKPDTELDVELRITSGTFLAHWPTAESAPNRLRWAKNPATSLVDQPADDTALMMVDEDHWFRRARQGDALYVDRGARAERFLAYDAELNLPAPVQLQGGPDVYQVINVSNAPVYDVLIARLTPEGLRVAWLDELPKSQSKTAGPAQAPVKAGSAAAGLFGAGTKKATPAEATEAAPKGDGQTNEKDAAPAAQPADAPAAKAPAANAPAAAAQPAAQEPKGAAGLFGVRVKKDGAAPAKDASPPAAAAGKDTPSAKPQSDPKKKPGLFGVAGQAPAAAAPSAQAPPAAAPDKSPAAQPSTLSLSGVEVRLSPALAAGSQEAAAQTTKALTERLAKSGLSPAEIEVFLSRYSPALFESSELVVLCRLNAGVLEEKVALSVFPVPAAIVRVPLVMVRNADPGLRNQIVELVSRLGDADFIARQDAEKRLVELGPLAFDALKKAIQDNDMEIVVRAERVLLKQNQPAAGRQGTGDAKGAKPPANAVLAAPAAPAAAK
ncbi:MAG: hypothetical protein AB7O59_18035 [Pirellulales bacterium]